MTRATGWLDQAVRSMPLEMPPSWGAFPVRSPQFPLLQRVEGYWLTGPDGGIFAFGDAPFDGSLPGIGVKVKEHRCNGAEQRREGIPAYRS